MPGPPVLFIQVRKLVCLVCCAGGEFTGDPTSLEQDNMFKKILRKESVSKGSGRGSMPDVLLLLGFLLGGWGSDKKIVSFLF